MCQDLLSIRDIGILLVILLMMAQQRQSNFSSFEKNLLDELMEQYGQRESKHLPSTLFGHIAPLIQVVINYLKMKYLTSSQ